MAATEDISLRIALDDRQAQAGLDSLRQQTAALASTAEGAAGGVGAIGGKVVKLKGLIEPTATAVNGMASAFGGLNTQTGAVLGGMSNLASAFMAGGQIGLGLVAAGTAISALTTAFQNNKKAAEEAAKAHKEVVDKIVKSALTPLEAATLSLNQANKELELQGMLTGKDSDQLVSNLRPVVMEIETLEVQIQASQRELKRLKLEAVEGIRKGESIEQMKARRQEAEKEVEATQAQLSLLQQARMIRIEETKVVAKSTQVMMDRNKALKEEEEARRGAEKAQQDADKQAEASLKFNEGLRMRYAALIHKHKHEREKQIQEQMAAQEKVGPTREMMEAEERRQMGLREKELEALKKAEAKKKEVLEKAAEERKKIQQQELKDTINEYKNLLGAVIGAGQTLVDDLITGQEKALERFAVAIMRQAGTFMVGKGLELGALATFNLLSGQAALVAQAPAQFAGAAALVGGGIALGAAATGIEHVAINGGQLGQAVQSGGGAGDRATSTPMGAGRISTGGTGERGGGGMEQVTYVFNAPVFGDQNRSARHVAALQRRGQRNLLLA
jgi:hypothetical protein